MKRFILLFTAFISIVANAQIYSPPAIYSDILSSTGSTTINTNTATAMAGMSFATPPAGKYMVDSLVVVTDSSSNNAIARTSIYCGGVLSSIETQAMPQFSSGGGLGAGTSTIPINSPNKTICTVNGTQSIELRWRTTAGTATSVGRMIMIERLNP